MVFQIDFEALRQVAAGAEPRILDGKRIAHALLDQVKGGVDALAERGVEPCLGVVQVGADAASTVYVQHKIRACKRVGIRSFHRLLPDSIEPRDLYALLDELNQDPQVNGVLLQLPLPDAIASHDAILRIEPRKDVDGFHPFNLGCLAAGRAELEPCTPRGIMRMLAALGVDCRGKNAVVIGRSVIVGRPMAQMLVRANATVTVCHRHTADLAAEVRRADIVVVAAGVPRLVKGDWIKPGAVVIDVGITRESSGRLVGDVEFDAAFERAAWITPVPGGVGPMTVATLLENTIRATCLHHRLRIVEGRAIDKDGLSGPENLRLTFV
ncbi:MAG: bifunctional methylenetetrahydrofolate dehydrogenase/methenyltetrahydrofolate cyclohydrolase FolD [Bradymonadaceae bacterium]|nr:bifunctional methylenetetrahydrofolate dehydrogenase/methenyltetrahydrofolate cyclohydrolase FolD [Lujinxingiaceae bacterium]